MRRLMVGTSRPIRHPAVRHKTTKIRKIGTRSRNQIGENRFCVIALGPISRRVDGIGE